MFGFYLIPRTIDKLRAELPGGEVGEYLNHDTGFSAYVVRKLGLKMDDVREAVARAADEREVEAWLGARIDPTLADEINGKLEKFTASRMSADDQVRVRTRHPVMAERPELDKVLDIIDAEDARAFANTKA